MCSTLVYFTEMSLLFYSKHIKLYFLHIISSVCLLYISLLLHTHSLILSFTFIFKSEIILRVTFGDAAFRKHDNLNFLFTSGKVFIHI